jgi:hypothetical protein
MPTDCGRLRRVAGTRCPLAREVPGWPPRPPRRPDAQRSAPRSQVRQRVIRAALGPPGETLVTIAPMIQATIAATVVAMADGRLALLLEMEPAPGLGPLVIDPVGHDPASVDRDGPGEGR